MQLRNKSLILVGISFLVSTALTQTNYSGKDIVFISGLKGIAIYDYFLKDSVPVLNGKYSFKSSPHAVVNENILNITEVNLDGKYVLGEKSGEWKQLIHQTTASNISTYKTTRVELRHKISGFEKLHSINYSNGKFNGEAKKQLRTITNGRYEKLKTIFSVQYDNDTVKGNFSISSDEPYVRIKGFINKAGFLDGGLSIRYIKMSDIIIEDRMYTNGFLTHLKKVNNRTGEVICDIVYKDVIEKLNAVSTDVSYKISDEWFGEKFTLGYLPTSEKMTQQEDGNRELVSHLTVFDSLFQEKPNKTILKLTRRFEFVYPSDEDTVFQLLSNQVKHLNEEITTFLNKPNLILKKQNGDSIYSHYKTTQHIQSKVMFIDSVLNLIQKGYFKYKFRDLFYKNGVDGLNATDTIVYEFAGQMRFIPFDLNNKVTSSKQLLPQLKKTYDELNDRFKQQSSSINQSLTVYHNQELIDSLDRSIVTLEYQLAQKYTLKDTEANLSYSAKVNLSINERHLSPLKNKYINHLIGFDETVIVGEEIVCYLTFLNDHFESFEAIGNYTSLWNDSLFTIYTENPFDSRKFETKVLGGIQNSANLLLKHYANQLLNVKSCKTANELIRKITTLNTRVKYLVSDRTNEKVQQLDKTIRRERIPERIERFFEI